MSDKQYQYGFSLQHPEVFDTESRTRKARTALAVFRDAFDGKIHDHNLLNLGSSSGAMDAVFAQAFAKVVGIDIDEHAIAYAKKHYAFDNLSFHVADGLNIPFPANSFDVVVCSQVYEHVPDQPRLFAEIYRVLKVGGMCYFAATNRLVLMEPHYKIYFLSWLPRHLADLYLRVRNKGDSYYERMHTLPTLQKLTRMFRVVDYTERILANPHQYEIEYIVRPGSLKQSVGRFIAANLSWICPGYIWILWKDG